MCTHMLLYVCIHMLSYVHTCSYMYVYTCSHMHAHVVILLVLHGLICKHMLLHLGKVKQFSKEGRMKLARSYATQAMCLGVLGVFLGMFLYLLLGYCKLNCNFTSVSMRLASQRTLTMFVGVVALRYQLD